MGRGNTPLARLVPELIERLPHLGHLPHGDSDADRYQLFEAVAELLAAASRRAPVLLVLEDLHWASHPTLLMLRHLVRSTRPMAVCLLATYRDSDLRGDHPLAATLADLRREPEVERISLVGFDTSHLRAFVQAAAGHDLDKRGEALVRALHAETGGNPFYAGEVLRHLVESGTIYRTGGRWTSDRTVDDVPLPESVREVVTRRLSHLTTTTRTLLSVASVVGPRSPLRSRAGWPASPRNRWWTLSTRRCGPECSRSWSRASTPSHMR